MEKKPLLIRLTSEQLSKLDISRLHLREKTLNKAVGRVIEEYFRFNNL